MNHHCVICDKVSRWRRGDDHFVIAEFRQTIFVVGDHQFFEGYSLLLLKSHVRELHDLGAGEQAETFRELMTATEALVKTYHPWKMNYASYGNVAPHVHWHLIPRYASDPDRESQPWHHAAKFDDYAIKAETANAISERIRSNL